MKLDQRGTENAHFKIKYFIDTLRRTPSDSSVYESIKRTCINGNVEEEIRESSKYSDIIETLSDVITINRHVPKLRRHNFKIIFFSIFKTS